MNIHIYDLRILGSDIKRVRISHFYYFKYNKYLLTGIFNKQFVDFNICAHYVCFIYKNIKILLKTSIILLKVVHLVFRSSINVFKKYLEI